MKNMIIFELRRAFFSRGFAIAASLGIALSIIHFLLIVMPYGTSEDWAYWRNGNFGLYPLSFYSTWIGATGYAFPTNLFYFLLPQLVCIPFANTHLTDRQIGLSNILVLRSSRLKYLVAKSIAIFFSAGCIALTPLFLSLVVTPLLMPLLPPEPSTSQFPIFSNRMWSDIYFSSPNEYIGLYLLLTFISSGLIASSTIVFQGIAKNKFVLVLMPIVALFSLSVIASSFGISGYLPNNAMIPYQPNPVQFKYLLLAYSSYFLLLLSAHIWLIKKPS